MTLRRKDDWDDALEEARRNGRPPETFIAGPDYDYGMRIECGEFLKPLTDKMRDILNRYSGEVKAPVTRRRCAMTFDEWWKENSLQYLSDSLHMTDLHVAAWVWDSAMEEAAKVAESHEVDYGNTSTVAAMDIRAMKSE